MGCFKYSPSNKRELKPSAVPTKYLTPLKESILKSSILFSLICFITAWYTILQTTVNCQDDNKFEINEPEDTLEVEIYTIICINIQIWTCINIHF